jgi:hypothetical protein
MWGIAIVDGQIVFVGINNAVAQDDFPKKDWLLGQTDLERNGAILSSLWKLYLETYIRYGNSSNNQAITNGIPELEPDSTKWMSPNLCLAGRTPGYCEGDNPNQFEGEDALFAPAE